MTVPEAGTAQQALRRSNVTGYASSGGIEPVWSIGGGRGALDTLAKGGGVQRLMSGWTCRLAPQRESRQL